MVQYATATELAGYLQQDLDTYSAVQALTLASEEFSSAADTWFTPTADTYVTTGTRCAGIWLPYNRVISVDEVRINTAIVTGWTQIGNRLYRPYGFGGYGSPVPDLVEVDLTHGYATVPDDVKFAVLEMAGLLYDNPTGAMTESIDDYTVRYDTTGKQTALSWRDVAARYRGTVMA